MNACAALALLVSCGTVLADVRDDPALRQATAQAQASLPQFLDHTSRPAGNSLTGASLLVMLRQGTDTPVEYLWIAPFTALDDKTFVGHLLTQPHLLSGLNADQVVHFNCSQIADWSWVPGDGRVWGTYTARTRTGLDAPAFAGLPLSPTPVPPEWAGSRAAAGLCVPNLS